MFRQLQHAFELLSDPERRAAHDRHDTPHSNDGARHPNDGESGIAQDVTVPPASASASASTAAVENLRARWMGVAKVWQLPASVTARPAKSWVVMAGAGFVLQASQPPGASPVLTKLDSATGLASWSAQFAASVDAAVVTGDVVVVTTNDAVVHGIVLDSGVTLWERPLSAAATCTTVLGIPDGTPDGNAGSRSGSSPPTVAIAAGDGVMAIDTSGSPRWNTRLGHGPVWMRSTETALVVATAGDTVVALDPRTGRPRWWVRHRVAASIGAVEASGIVWLADGGRGLVGLDPSTGAAAHVVDIGEPVAGICCVDDRLVVTTSSAALVALGPTGRPRWKMHMPAGFTAPVADGGVPIADGGVLVVAVADGSLRMLWQRTGAELHHVLADLGPIDGPATLVMNDPMVVITGINGAAVGLQRIH